jgi:hypothetical protein
MSTTFNVTTVNTLFQFAFAGYYENPGHNCCDQPGLYLRVINACGGNTVASCSSMTLAANCGSLANVTFTSCGPNGVMSNWQVKVIDLTPYIGGCVTIEAWTADCNFGGHYGTTFFDASCGGQLIGQGLGGIPGGPIPGPVSFCSGSGVATIAAPAGDEMPDTPLFISPMQQQLELLKQQGGKQSTVINQIVKSDNGPDTDPSDGVFADHEDGEDRAPEQSIYAADALDSGWDTEEQDNGERMSGTGQQDQTGDTGPDEDETRIIDLIRKLAGR